MTGHAEVTPERVNVRVAGYSATCGKRWSNPPNECIGIAPAHVAFHQVKSVAAPDCIFSELNTQAALRG
jgi:hypothetical protein